MIRHMLASAVFAGFAAGLFAAMLQFVWVQPVLLAGERYESGELVHHAAAVPHGTHDAAQRGGAGHAAAEPGADGPGSARPAFAMTWERDGLTVLFTTLVYSGYALLLVAGFALAETAGMRVSARAGIIWGLAGFAAAQLAPAMGAPPELPGMAGADLTARQVWWVATAVCTAAGLWFIGLGRRPPAWALGAALVALPHLIGAPHPDAMTGPVPPELAALFAARTLGVGLAVWAVLGWLAGGFWNRARA